MNTTTNLLESWGDFFRNKSKNSDESYYSVLLTDEQVVKEDTNKIRNLIIGASIAVTAIIGIFLYIYV
jgi:hypothetical protein